MSVLAEVPKTMLEKVKAVIGLLLQGMGVMTVWGTVQRMVLTHVLLYHSSCGERLNKSAVKLND